MKKLQQGNWIFGGAALWLLMLAFIPCCDDEVTHPRGEEGIITRVTVQPHRAAPGDELLLCVVVENRRAESFELDFGCIQQFGYSIEIPDSGGFIYDPCLVSPALSHLSIPAWGNKTISMTVSTNRGAYCPDDWPLSEDLLPPGSYRIRGGILGNKYPWGADHFVLQ